MTPIVFRVIEYWCITGFLGKNAFVILWIQDIILLAFLIRADIPKVRRTINA
jgi:hypothetical protein